MYAVWISVAVSVAGLFASIGASAYISGMRWGTVKTDIEYMRRDIATLMAYFRLAPVDQHDNRRR